MTARIFLFPPERRLGLIRRQVAAVADYSPAARRNAVEGTLTRQRQALTKLVEPEIADDYCTRLRREILARLPKAGDHGERAS